EKGVKVDANTVFQVASNSKTVTVWGVMRQVESGKLALNTPVGKYLTRWKLPQTKYDNNGVTLRRLLSHTAGMSQSSYAGYPPGEKLPTLIESLSGQAKGVKELHVIRKPGVKYKYSGGGYTLIQLMLEEVTGKPFSKYMEEEVLTPLGMINSSYEWRPELRAKTSIAYGALGQPLPNYLFTEKAAAGLYTTATDFARFVAANLNTYGAFAGEDARMSIISKRSLELAYTPGDKDYGFGYIIKKLPDNTRLIYHGGTNRGWRSQFALLPGKGDGLVVLTNSEYGANLHSDLLSVFTKWETGYWPKLYYTNLILRILIKTVALLLGLLLLLIIWRIIKEVREGKRFFIFGAKAPGVPVARLAVGILAPALLISIWWIVFYTGLIYNGWAFASFLPAGFNWLTVLAVCYGIFWFMQSLVMKKRQVGSIGREA
ncbi:MAG TPA: serine hydrolase domain-containing protein, partial [Bacillota bacterium]|nr:serine hydrolase domain-containing protein [Bacillota bacterium]